jgi:hypothetical protein
MTGAVFDGNSVRLLPEALPPQSSSRLQDNKVDND